MYLGRAIAVFAVAALRAHDLTVVLLPFPLKRKGIAESLRNRRELREPRVHESDYRVIGARLRQSEAQSAVALRIIAGHGAQPVSVLSVWSRWNHVRYRFAAPGYPKWELCFSDLFEQRQTLRLEEIAIIWIDFLLVGIPASLFEPNSLYRWSSKLVT